MGLRAVPVPIVARCRPHFFCQMDSHTPLSLYQLNALLQDTLEDCFPHTLWVTGELSEARQASNGHFYGELIEKDDSGTNVVARMRITCWARVYAMLRLRFEQETGQELRAGLGVMLAVQVAFHPSFGLSLNVVDIDAQYTLGSVALRRREILRQLEEDGIVHDNQLIALPTLLQRIAVVSAPTAAGYGDFCHHLQHNPHHLHFHTQLFPATMQGRQVPQSVLAALMAIAEEAEQWDAVVIIRGGGATADLSDFDSYPLAACIAQFALPVIVGIGHERDETVLDHVAHRAVKTPTAAADFFIAHQQALLQALEQSATRMEQAVHTLVHTQQLHLQRLSGRFPLAVHACTHRAAHRLDIAQQRLVGAAQRTLLQATHSLSRLDAALPTQAALLLERQRHRLSLLEQQVEMARPERILSKGYSLTLLHGRVLTDASQVKPGALLVTRLAHGQVVSTMKETIIEETKPQE